MQIAARYSNKRKKNQPFSSRKTRKKRQFTDASRLRLKLISPEPFLRLFCAKTNGFHRHFGVNNARITRIYIKCGTAAGLNLRFSAKTFPYHYLQIKTGDFTAKEYEEQQKSDIIADKSAIFAFHVKQFAKNEPFCR